MPPATPTLTASEAARRLGVSAKALRLYEQHGLICPVRSEAGWRTYGPADLARAEEIAGLRALGFSLAQVGRVLRGEPEGLEPALAAHKSVLEARHRDLADTIAAVSRLRADLAAGAAPKAAELVRLARPATAAGVAVALPWPWAGEQFELRTLKPITYLTGPLGSGKTRLAQAIADAVPGAVYVGLDRLEDDAAAARARLAADAALASRVDRDLAWLAEEGAVLSPALLALLAALNAEGAAALVVDMVEEGLDVATQAALIAHLRRRLPGAPPLVLMTRSTAILDLAATGPEEAIVYCPANHGVPMEVTPVAAPPATRPWPPAWRRRRCGRAPRV